MNKTFKALSDPTRRKILELIKEKDRTVGDVSEHFNISRFLTSEHLVILEDAKIISAERVEEKIVYSVNTTVFQEIWSWIFNFRDRSEVTYKDE